jgi:pantothenate kinase-related protein Tda10
MKTFDKPLTITVSGCCGQGKSTIATFIYDALIAAGIKKVTFKDDEPKLNAERVFTNLTFNVDNFDIKVETRQLNRKCFEDNGEPIKNI